MLRVSYKKVYGYFYLENLDGKLFKCTIHPANCEFAVVYHDRKRKLAHLIAFFIDMNHLKRCFERNETIFDGRLKQVTFYTNMPHFERYVKIIANCGIKIKILYKEQ